MKKIINNRLYRTLIIVFVTLLVVTGACFGYLSTYYHTDNEAVEAFSSSDNVETTVLENGNIVFESKESTVGFIFYPGGKVEYTAYIPLMQECAEKGITCVLVKMPFNLAVFDINAADGIMEDFPCIREWYIGGHSLGGSMAASYLEKNKSSFSGLVLLGSYSTADLSKTDLKVLSVYGSNDGVMNREKYNANKENLPDDFTEKIIDGGNHAGFGVYGEQKGDGKANISNQEQIKLTAEFIEKISHENEQGC